jgi:hypothetical protein
MPLDDAFWSGERQRLYQLLFPRIETAAVAGARYAFDDLAAEVGIGTDWGLVNSAASDWAESYTYELVSQISETSRDFLRTAISDWTQSGEPLSALADTIDAASLFGPVRSEMIAVTEVTRAYAEGNKRAWRASGVVDGMRWNNAEDGSVCDICGPLGGVEANLDGLFVHPETGEEFDSPPGHVACRCWLTPIVRTSADQDQPSQGQDEQSQEQEA